MIEGIVCRHYTKGGSFKNYVVEIDCNKWTDLKDILLFTLWKLIKEEDDLVILKHDSEKI